MGFGMRLALVFVFGAFLIFGCIGQQPQPALPNGTNGSAYPPGPPAANATAIPDTILSANVTMPFDLEKSLAKVPDPLSGDNPVYHLVPRSVPQPGESFKDPDFGTNLTRVTKNLGIRNEYSRFDAFNKAKTMVILTVPVTGEWKVFRAGSIPYDMDANLVATISLEDPRWDPQQPDIVWGLRDFSIITVNVTDGSEAVAKDFSADSTIGPIIRAEPDLYRITMSNEGESSIDKRYWAFILQGTGEDYRPRYVFTWDLARDKILGTYRIAPGESAIDWVGMSSLGNYVLIGGDDTDRGNITGFMMADKELKRFHKLDYATAHSDVGLDQEGKEVIVMQNTRTDYIDMIPIDWDTKSIDETGGSYDGTNRVALVKLYYDSESPHGLGAGTSVHMSCNAPGYCVVSTSEEPGTLEQNWLDRSIILVKLDRQKPEAYYLAKVYGTRGDYWEETHATITTDGKRVLWATNWGQGVGQENAKSVFEIQLDLG